MMENISETTYMENDGEVSIAPFMGKLDWNSRSKVSTNRMGVVLCRYVNTL
jgi:hypothetical protein